MAELERNLQVLAGEIEWPATPELAPPPLPERGRRVPRRPLLVVAAALLIAAAVAALVPGARSAVLHWFRIGGASVERVQTLPPTTEGPLAAGLGQRVSAAEAEQALGIRIRLPRRAEGARLYLSNGVVSALLQTDAGPVLLSELRSQVPVPMLVKKLAADSTKMEFLSVAPGGTGVWLSGAMHAVIFPEAPPRLAGDVLLWDADGITYRLEGARLAKQRALALAREVVTG